MRTVLLLALFALCSIIHAAEAQSDEIVRTSILTAYTHTMQLSRALRSYNNDNKLIHRIIIDHSTRIQTHLEHVYLTHKHLVGALETDNDNNKIRIHILAQLTMIDDEAKQMNDLLIEIAPKAPVDDTLQNIITAFVEFRTLIQTAERHMGHEIE